MASSAKDTQLRELKDTVSQLKTMIAEQTELIKALRLIIDEKTSHEKALQEQVDYLTKKLFGPSSERRSDDIPGQQNLFDEAEVEQDPSLLEGETVIREHTRKKKATHEELFKGLKVEKVVVPLPEEDQICPVCGTQMVLIGEEYVRRELEFIPATCKVIEYWMPLLQGRTRRYRKACDRKVSGSASSAWKRTCISSCSCMDYVPEVCQRASTLPAGKGLEAVWGADQPDDPCKLDHLLFKELFSANVRLLSSGAAET